MSGHFKSPVEIVVLLSDSASSDGDNDDYVPAPWIEECSSPDLSSDEEEEPRPKKRKRGPAVKVHRRIFGTNTNCNSAPRKPLPGDSSSNDELAYNWTRPNITQPVLPPFTATWGCRVNTENFLPINYFQLFLDDEYLQKVVEQTNLYAVQYFLEQQKKPGGGNMSSEWTPTNLSEMRRFWGLTLHMGIAQKPSIEAYWSPKSPQTRDIFLAMMSASRFQLLQKFLHYNDNTLAVQPDHPQFDDLFKLRPLLDHLLKRFQEVYTPGQNLVVDRSLLRYQGHIVPQEYFPKGEQYCKLHRLCESSSGYTYRFRVCINKALRPNSSEYSTDLGISEKIVDDLVHPLYNQGYQIYMNHVYTNLSLFRLLYRKGTLACGTIRHFRKGLPRELRLQKQKKGESSLWRCEELLAVRYKGNKDQVLLTTIHDESTLAFAMGVEQNVTKPRCLLDYKYYMSGVERSKQMLEPYIARLRTMGWYKRLSVYLVQLSMFNAYVVYHQATSHKRLSFLKFQESVIQSLIGSDQFTIAAAEPEVEERLVGRHFPELIPSTTKTSPQRRCCVCQRRGFRKDTRYYCPDCPRTPAMCLRNCFRTYHTKEDYF
ncbi:piggyBac transposable element-derived protein 4-like [Gastrophryne carolinensis]